MLFIYFSISFVIFYSPKYLPQDFLHPNQQSHFHFLGQNPHLTTVKHSYPDYSPVNSYLPLPIAIAVEVIIFARLPIAVLPSTTLLSISVSPLFLLVFTTPRYSNTPYYHLLYLLDSYSLCCQIPSSLNILPSFHL